MNRAVPIGKVSDIFVQIQHAQRLVQVTGIALARRRKSRNCGTNRGVKRDCRRCFFFFPQRKGGEIEKKVKEQKRKRLSPSREPDTDITDAFAQLRSDQYFFPLLPIPADPFISAALEEARPANQRGKNIRLQKKKNNKKEKNEIFAPAPSRAIISITIYRSAPSTAIWHSFTPTNFFNFIENNTKSPAKRLADEL